MEKEKGSLKIIFLIFLIIIVAGIYFWFKHFSKPATTVLTGGAEYSLPALDKAKKVGDKANKAVQATDEATKRIEGMEQGD
ncbi:MAG: hypothetical protein JW914_03650 [Syntrophaceae bacterium]|nr:hypothetical protein [Syntrophaceae bacterium]